MHNVNKITEYFFLAGVLTLPIYRTLNHWFFGAFIFLSLVSFFLIRSFKSDLKLIGKHVVIFSALFLFLRILTLLYSPDFNLGLKQATRALPFLLYPLGALSIKNQKNFNFEKFENKFFWSLSIGCILTAIICWGNIILSLEQDPIPANKLFGWKKSGSYLTAILDLHPPYLGMLICGSILFMFKEVYYGKNLILKTKFLIYFLIFFLLVFLFNLTARNTLFYIIITALVFFVYKKQWKYIVSIFLLLVISILVVVKHPSQYYRLKMYHMLGLSDNKDYEDKRFKRLEASYIVFKSHPFFGAGLGRDLDLKILEYEKMNDEIAIKKKLNSHNQFFEYLAAYGIIGGLIFVLAIFILIYFLFRHKYYFYLLLFLNLIFATITESIFERAMGIQYYSLLISIVVLKHISRKKQE